MIVPLLLLMKFLKKAEQINYAHNKDEYSSYYSVEEAFLKFIKVLPEKSLSRTMS